MKRSSKRKVNKKTRRKTNIKAKKKPFRKTKTNKKTTGKINKKRKKNPNIKIKRKTSKTVKKKTSRKTKRKTKKKTTEKINKETKKTLSRKTKRKRNKKIKEKSKKRKSFIVPSILITAFLFVFFQLSNTFNKNLSKGISQSDHSIDELQTEQSITTETTDEDDSFVDDTQEEIVEEINENDSFVDDTFIDDAQEEVVEEKNEQDSLVEEAQNENANNVDEKEFLEEEQNVVSKMVDDRATLEEQADNEIVKMIDESSFSPAKLQYMLRNFLNKQILNGPYDVKPILDQSQSIISENDLKNSKTVELLQVSYCSKCQPQDPPECDPCVEKSESRGYMQGQQICRDALPIGYSAPGRIDICRGIESFIIAEFIYFEQLGNQLDLGALNITSPTPQEFEILKFKTDYQPGFKVGIGTHFKRDDWDLFVQYTRLHKTKNTIFDPSNKTGTFNTPWFHTNISQFTLSTITTDIKATWKIDLDKIDLELGRSYYLGNSLIARPFVSLAGHRLDQRYDLSLITSQLYGSSIKNDSWSIGPRLGLLMNWFFYKGFNLFGYGAFSLMFAKNEISGSGDENLVIYNVKKIDKYILRDLEELKLG
nr:hypothetical protein [Candidatus Anoxychlamydiales bacterium]